jgi:hypothetical protein
MHVYIHVHVFQSYPRALTLVAFAGSARDMRNMRIDLSVEQMGMLSCCLYYEVSLVSMRQSQMLSIGV